MSLALSLIVAAATMQAAPPPLSLPSAQGQVIAWDTLPPVPYRTPPVMLPDMMAFVAGEVAAGRCRVANASGQRGEVVVDVAMLVTPDTGPRLTIPRALDCPTVEQYAAGLVLSFSRDNLPGRAIVPQWYRATLRFRWPG